MSDRTGARQPDPLGLDPGEKQQNSGLKQSDAVFWLKQTYQAPVLTASSCPHVAAGTQLIGV